MYKRQAQGYGQAATEAAIYDETGQLLSGSFMDYALPRASDLPFIALHDAPTYTKTCLLYTSRCV